MSNSTATSSSVLSQVLPGSNIIKPNLGEKKPIVVRRLKTTKTLSADFDDQNGPIQSMNSSGKMSTRTQQRLSSEQPKIQTLSNQQIKVKENFSNEYAKIQEKLTNDIDGGREFSKKIPIMHLTVSEPNERKPSSKQKCF